MPLAWAFTRIMQSGVCRYLKNVGEVNSPRFFLSISPYRAMSITNLNIMNMRTKLFLMLFALLVMAGTSYAHVEPLHVDGRYLKNPNGDIVTLHGWIGPGNIYWDQTAHEDYESIVKASKLTVDSILAVGYKMDCVRVHFGYGAYGTVDPLDFDASVRCFEEYLLPMIDYLNEKDIYVLLMCDCDVDDALRTERKVGESWQQRLLKYWDYASSHPRIKNNPGVMFELSNELPITTSATWPSATCGRKREDLSPSRPTAWR